MGVSILFRDLCQQDFRVIDNLVVVATQNDDKYLFKTLHLRNGIVREMKFCSARHRIHGCPDAEHLKVVVGSQRDRRSILPDMEVCLRPVEKDEPSKTCSALTVLGARWEMIMMATTPQDLMRCCRQVAGDTGFSWGIAPVWWTGFPRVAAW